MIYTLLVQYLILFTRIIFLSRQNQNKLPLKQCAQSMNNSKQYSSSTLEVFSSWNMQQRQQKYHPLNPFKTIGMVVSQFNNPLNSNSHLSLFHQCRKIGTGFFIDHNKIITSASNLCNLETKNANKEASSVIFYPQFNSTASSDHKRNIIKFDVRSYQFNTKFKFSSNQSKYQNNYAVLFLQNSEELKEYVKNISIYKFDSELMLNKIRNASITSDGYKFQRINQVQFYENFKQQIKIQKASQGLLCKENNKITKGQVGSPIFVRQKINNGQHTLKVIGIIVEDCANADSIGISFNYLIQSKQICSSDIQNFEMNSMLTLPLTKMYSNAETDLEEKTKHFKQESISLQQYQRKISKIRALEKQLKQFKTFKRNYIQSSLKVSKNGQQISLMEEINQTNASHYVQKQLARCKNPREKVKLIDKKYFIHSEQKLSVLKHNLNINASVDKYTLNHNNYKINFAQFLKYNWCNLQVIYLCGCQLDDQAWRVFVRNSTAFPSLKMISIFKNNIETIVQGDLQSYEKLEKIQFYFLDPDSGQEFSNPISKKSIAYLENFGKHNKNVQVKFQKQKMFTKLTNKINEKILKNF